MIRTGIGYDLHRLVSGRPLLLGGVHIPFDKGEDGHSDGDVLLHALTDALLGAAGLGDIGEFSRREIPAGKTRILHNCLHPHGQQSRTRAGNLKTSTRL